MPSPFPGMDPYLEQEPIWHDFHERFLPVAAAQLSAQVLPRYIVLIDEHVYVNDPGRTGGRTESGCRSPREITHGAGDDGAAV